MVLGKKIGLMYVSNVNLGMGNKKKTNELLE